MDWLSQIKWDSLLSGLIGAGVGGLCTLLGAWIAYRGIFKIERDKRLEEENSLKLKHLKLLHGIIVEIIDGIDRCTVIASRQSYSLIYLSFWESCQKEFASITNNVELLKKIHKIYYYFSLINFNSQRGEFARSTTFAEQYSLKIVALTEEILELFPRISLIQDKSQETEWIKPGHNRIIEVIRQVVIYFFPVK